MSSEVPRVYRELIEEVIRSTEDDNYRMGIDRSVLEEIKNSWIGKICEYTDIGEYRIRHSYNDSRVGMEGYYNNGYQYPEYAYREYPYPYCGEKDKEDPSEDQYDGLSEPAQEEELDSNDLSESDCGVDNEETTKNVMLCLFDKVTRVKDKRRCTLKHGFLSIGRTDYTFNIANGDLEW